MRLRTFWSASLCHAVTVIARGARLEQLQRDRAKMLRDLGMLGPAEPRMLIDMITAAAPGKTAALLAIRP
jgi:hypothetical protein